MDEQRGHDAPSSKQIAAARLIGKLFGKEKEKRGNQDDYIASFLQRPSDTLYMNGADPTQNAAPKLAKLDTFGARRWPTASEVIQMKDSSQRRSTTTAPRPNRKGLMVRFTDKKPDIIGEGGDEAEAPTAHISASKRRARANSQVFTIQSQPRSQHVGGYDGPDDRELNSLPVKESRSQPSTDASTGQPLAASLPRPPASSYPRKGGVAGNHSTPVTANSRVNNSDHGSLVAKMQKEMKISEGQALIADQQNPRSSVQRRPLPHGGTPLEPFLSQSAESWNGEPKTGGADVRPSMPPPDHSDVSRVSHLRSNSRSSQNMPPVQPELQSISRPIDVPVQPLVSIQSEGLDEFTDRVGYLYKLFELSAESKEPLPSSSFENLLRAASWWFLRGRSTIEHIAKRRAPNSENVDILQQQGNADLAKCSWILGEVLSRRPEIDNRSPDEVSTLERRALASGHDDIAKLLERYRALYSNLKKLTGSMKKNNIMPPPSNDAILTQGLNTLIWIDYPWQDPSIQSLFSGVKFSSILSPKGSDSISSTEALPLGDTDNMFTYSRVHVGVCLDREGHEPQRHRFPCILSVQRERNDKLISAVISSQDGTIAICIQSKKGYSPSWQDVTWDTKRELVDVKLGKYFRARILFSPGDLTTLWNMYEYTSKVHANLLAHNDETLLLETTVRSAQYVSKDPSDQIFPKDAALHCKVRVFEKIVVETSRTGPHTRHRGLRLAVATGPNTKSLCGITHDLPTIRPIRFENTRIDYGSCLSLYFGGDPSATLSLTFETQQDRWVFHNYLIGGQRPNESTAVVLPLKNFSLTRAAESQSASTPRMVLDSLQWNMLHVIVHNKGSDFNSPAVQSAGHLRIISESHNNERVTDRIPFTPGELKIRVNTKNVQPRLSILRSTQEDLTISCPESKTPPEVRQRLAQLLSLVAKVPTARHYTFSTLEDMHSFQYALTGFSVLFDGIAATFAISRRRMVVPIHKKWEAQQTCVQLLERDGVVQLVAYFEDFSHGESMNFAVKATDLFESFTKGGNFGVKLADAKFVLPRQEEEGAGADNGFVCLDILEYPVEHDDILIMFDTEDERDRFSRALPSETKHVSRFGSHNKR